MESIIPIFSTPIFVDDSYVSTKEEIDFVKNVSYHSNVFNLSSDESYILNTKELKNLKNYCQLNLQKYFYRIYSPENKFDIKITNSWTNITRGAQSHHPHKHANSFISAVFYIQTSNEDSIYFDSQKENYIDFEKKINEFNCQTWILPVKKNMLIIFPSTLKHGVGQIKDNRIDRISLSFNSFVFGELGSNRKKYKLVIS